MQFTWPSVKCIVVYLHCGNSLLGNNNNIVLTIWESCLWNVRRLYNSWLWCNVWCSLWCLCISQQMSRMIKVAILRLKIHRDSRCIHCFLLFLFGKGRSFPNDPCGRAFVSLPLIPEDSGKGCESLVCNLDLLLETLTTKVSCCFHILLFLFSKVLCFKPTSNQQDKRCKWSVNL